MFDQELEATIEQVIKNSERQNYEFITVEYLLLCLLDNQTCAKILISCGADLEMLRHELLEFVATTPVLAPQNKRKIMPTLGFSRVLERAKSQAAANNHALVNSADILIAMYSERDSYAIYLLKKQDVMRIDIAHYLLHGIRKKPAPSTPISLKPGIRKPAANPLQDFTTNLNEQAKLGAFDPLVGRNNELMRIYQILMLRHKNNPLLVGDTGVGKTAIVQGLAYKIVHNEVPKIFKDCVIYSLDLAALLAGSRYRGELEARLKILIMALQRQPHAILFIDDIHNIIGAGGPSGGFDAANLLKPILASRQMRCIGSTTFSEYRHIFAKNHTLARRFAQIDVSAPSISETIAILHNLKPKLEQHHRITYEVGALQAAANMSERYLNDRNLPDKAIDVLDEAGAYQSLYQPLQPINSTEIEEIIAKIAKIPPQTVSSDDKEQLRSLEQTLKSKVFGQDGAIGDLSSAIKLARAGLKAENKPIGSFLFAGPTGVGKTEVAKQLAKALSIDLVRFDMSEYMERHAVSRLIGAPPGYVGFDQGGLLTESVSKTPHAVLLLDEIEKAHSELFNLLLQVMDNGFLTDSNGRKTDFRNVILIMTTNAGAEDTARASMGFLPQNHSSDALQIIKKTFSPEFRNRLDGIIEFNNLTLEIVKSIAKKFILELKEQLALKNVDLELTFSAYDFLAQKGFDPQMGARPMARLIQDLIKRPMAEDILFGKLSGGGAVIIDLDEQGELKLDIISSNDFTAQDLELEKSSKIDLLSF